jgi:tetratricopeptide (TPR) repeat protein
MRHLKKADVEWAILLERPAAVNAPPSAKSCLPPLRAACYTCIMSDESDLTAKTVLYCLAQGKLEKARSEAERLRAMAPDAPQTLAVLGDLALAEHQPQQAFDLWMRGADGFHKLGQPERVLACQQRIVRLEPARLNPVSQARHRLLSYLVPAEGRLASGDLEGALEAYRLAVKANPNHTVGYQRLASLLARMGRRDEACEQYLVVGRAFLGHNLAAKAKPFYQRVLELEPRHHEALAALAEILQAEGALAESGRMKVCAAEGALEQGDLAQAALLVRQLQALAPGSAVGFYLSGILSLKQGHREEARESFARFLAASPHLRALMQQSGAAVQEPKALPAGPLAHVDMQSPLAALSMQPGPLSEDDLVVLLTMGEMCLAEEMFDEGKQIYERVLRSRPGSEEAFNNLNQARIGLGLPALRVPTGVSLAPTRDAASVSRLPLKPSTLPSDPLEYLAQMEAQGLAYAPASLAKAAAPQGASLPPLPPLPPLPALPSLAAKPAETQPVSALGSVLAGELKDRVVKGRITRTAYQLSAGELPPAGRYTRLEEDIIE